LKCIVNNNKNASDERFASKRKLYTAICLRLADQNARPRPPQSQYGPKRNLVAADNAPAGYAAIWRLIRYASSYTSSMRRGLRRLETNDLRRPGLWRIFLPARFADKNHREIQMFDQSYKESRRYAEMWRVTDLKTWYEAVAKSLPIVRTSVETNVFYETVHPDN